MTIYDPIQITRLYVFGTDTPSPDDYNAHIRAANAEPASIPFDMHEYLTNGAGRYAYPSLFKAIEKIFSKTIPDSTSAENGNRYTYTELKTQLSAAGNPIDEENGLHLTISQYGTDITSADYYNRAYIFGTTKFTLNLKQATFEVTNGKVVIRDMDVTADQDNFDYDSPSGFAEIINTYVLEPSLDPYNLSRGPDIADGKAVKLIYTTTTGRGRVYPIYDELSYSFNQNQDDFVSVKSDLSHYVLDAAGIASFLLPDGQAYFQNLLNDPFLSYVHNGKKVIYGTPDSDNLDPLDSERSFDEYKGYYFVGGAGDDTLSGSLYFADEILGGEGNDTLIGNGGNDILEGGQGNDTYTYTSGDGFDARLC
jgi:Ca2+-binding RTX toxin-like protein